jgi:hypothetical protein
VKESLPKRGNSKTLMAHDDRLTTGLEKQKQDNLREVEMHVELLTGQSLRDKMKTTVMKQEQKDMELA